jgi:TIR domain
MEVPLNRQPVVYISYSWIDEFDPIQQRWGRVPDPRARELADRLREDGVDVRLDVYFLNGLHGFSPPQPIPGETKDPWLAWSAQQIAEADSVLLFCTPEYARCDPSHRRYAGEWSDWSQLDERTRISQQYNVPARWWDWYAINQESSNRPQKFVPIGLGHYHRDQMPPIIRGASYIDLAIEAGYDTLLRRILRVWHERVPRQGIFISYAHKDDEHWLQTLGAHLSWLERKHDVEIWSDRNIQPGEKWRRSIQAALHCAKVALLLVSPDFLNSDYITNSELPKMLQAAESDGMTIFWIPVRPSSYKHSPISEFQSAHTPEKPLSTLSAPEQDQAFVAIGEKLAATLGFVAL